MLYLTTYPVQYPNKDNSFVSTNGKAIVALFEGLNSSLKFKL